MSVPVTIETFFPVRVELYRVALKGGGFVFGVDYVEACGGRCWMWSGSSYSEAIRAAEECAELSSVPVVDVVNASFRAMPIETRRAILATARLCWDDKVIAELTTELGLDPPSETKH